MYSQGDGRAHIRKGALERNRQCKLQK